MATRPVWRGQLRLALVSCPVALHAVHTEHANLHFHFINPETGHRVRMVTEDAETGAELSRRDLARGYEFRKDHYLVLTDEDFESARIDSSSTLKVDKFVDSDAIDPIYFDAAYYVAPDGEAGEDVYAVLQEAIRATGRLALSRVVIARRERALAIRPFGRGLVAHTLYEQRDIIEPDELFAPVPKDKQDTAMVKLATQLIDRQTAAFEPADMEDRYEARLREVIAAKLHGEGIAPEPEEERPDNVVDLMTALKQSLGEAPSRPAAAAKKKPARRKRA
jgi:DNA end-binding protein Ku